MKTYQAWTKDKEGNEVYTELRCESKDAFRKYQKEHNRKITSDIFVKRDK